MYGHKINALFGLAAYHVEEILDGHFHDGFFLPRHLLDAFVEGDRPQWNRALFYDFLPEMGHVAPDAQVHDGIGAVPDGGFKFYQFSLEVKKVGTGADIGVYLGSEPLSHADRFDGTGRVFKDTDMSPGKICKQGVNGNALFFCHGPDFRGHFSIFCFFENIHFCVHPLLVRYLAPAVPPVTGLPGQGSVDICVSGVRNIKIAGKEKIAFSVPFMSIKKWK